LEVAVVVAENHQADLPGILPGFLEWLQPSEIKEISIIKTYSYSNFRRYTKTK
jgi:hypothetical protein